MATFNQLKYDLLLLKNGGVLSDDDPLTLSQLGFWINNTRATLIRQDLNKKRSISDNIIQDLGCVPVIYVDAAQCCNLAIGCSVLRTVDKIPRPVEIDHKDLITRVGPNNVTSIEWLFVPYNRAQVARHGRYSKNMPKAFYHNGYIFVINPPDGIEFINIQGVFEDPAAVKSFSTCSGTPCYSDDDEYPISAWMIEIMKTAIKNNNLSLFMIAPTDITGNSKFDPEQPVQQ